MDDKKLERLKELQREHDELEASIPAHSMKASKLERLEDLEDEIDELRKELESAKKE